MRLRVGFIGWRGMVGSVLMERLNIEQDWQHMEPVLFSTSQVGQQSPSSLGIDSQILQDAYDLESLKSCDVLVSTQGSSYSQSVQPQLVDLGWQGYWLDAASAFRMDEDSCIVLDPVNRRGIDVALEQGVRKFVGGNCTVSLMLLAIAGLVSRNLVKSIWVTTFQAASGGGAQHMKELMAQMAHFGSCYEAAKVEPALQLEEKLTALARSGQLQDQCFGAPLAGGLLPWIDVAVAEGMTREEWKAEVEGNKILGRQGDELIPIESTCVRVAALRCHSQALRLELTEDLSLESLTEILVGAHEWLRLVPNEQSATLQQLNPHQVSGKLDISIGRLRKSAHDPYSLSLFTIGDQLLWGAAEPLRRMLKILIERVI